MAIEIGYWKIRGLVGTFLSFLCFYNSRLRLFIFFSFLGGARLLLEYAGADWKETMYEVSLPDGADPNDFSKWDRSDWTDKKKTDEFQKNFHFPNLPWLKDGDVCISQSTAILKVKFRPRKN